MIPCYNEASALPALIERVAKLRLTGKGRIELMLVDDGSGDGTWESISRCARGRPGVTGVRLSSNQGNQRAILSGLFAAGATAIAVLDADGQDPVEDLAPMFELLKSSAADAVIGLKITRRDANLLWSLAKDAAAWPMPFKPGEGDFCLLSRACAQAILRYGRADTAFRVRRYWALRGREPLYWPYQRQGRTTGETKFDAWKLSKLWWRIFRDLYILGVHAGPAYTPSIAETTAGI